MKQRKKRGMATAVLAIVAVVGVGTAAATHVFDDVPESAFYAAAVEWAADNGITTGTSASTFDPDREMTRGEGVTLLERYDSKIVQPARAEVDAAVAGATDLLGGMHFAAIDVRIDTGETGVLGSLDGVTIKLDCIEEFGSETDLRVYAESSLDGWYMTNDSSEALTSGDDPDFIATFDYGPTAEERAARTRSGFNVITANGGHMGISGDTATFILNSSVDSADCIFRGMLQWSEPAP